RAAPDALEDRRPEELELLAVYAEDLVARPDPGRLCGRVRLDLADADTHVRGEQPRDEEEDDEGDEQVHEHAGEQDDQLRDEWRPLERPRVTRVVAVLALELHEPADGQPVERSEEHTSELQSLA